jgi:hypothetical protein
MPIMNVNIPSLLLFLLSLSVIWPVQAQQALKPGFDALEYAMLLKLGTSIKDPQAMPEGKAPSGEMPRLIFRSEVTGLDNRWDLWLIGNHTGIIEVRGTTAKTISWIGNFYAGMVPATGSIQLRKGHMLNYRLAEHPGAAVHAGWLTGLAAMLPIITGKINEYYLKGVKQFILMGHSQGAGIVFLLDSYLHYDVNGEIPDDIIFKTYNSGAPKPGNLYYSYDYSYINRGGWAFRVVNTSDWVPETPIAVQDMDDFNEINPFADRKTFTRSLSWMQGIILKSIFRKNERSLRKASGRLNKYLGRKLFRYVGSHLPEMTEPAYVSSMNYTAAGTPVILPPTENYHRDFLPSARQDLFIHHTAAAYLFLLNEHYDIDQRRQ